MGAIEQETDKYFGYVYVIAYGDDKTYKIGHTNNLSQRIKAINKASVVMPYEYELLIAAPVQDRIALERLLHKRFEASNVRGEWFNLDVYDLADVARIMSAVSLNRTIVYTERWFSIWDEFFAAMGDDAEDHMLTGAKPFFKRRQYSGSLFKKSTKVDVLDFLKVGEDERNDN